MRSHLSLNWVSIYMTQVLGSQKHPLARNNLILLVAATFDTVSAISRTRPPLHHLDLTRGEKIAAHGLTSIRRRSVCPRGELVWLAALGFYSIHVCYLLFIWHVLHKCNAFDTPFPSVQTLHHQPPFVLVESPDLLFFGLRYKLAPSRHARARFAAVLSYDCRSALGFRLPTWFALPTYSHRAMSFAARLRLKSTLSILMSFLRWPKNSFNL